MRVQQLSPAAAAVVLRCVSPHGSREPTGQVRMTREPKRDAILLDD